MSDERNDIMAAASISEESGEAVIVSVERNTVAVKIRNALLAEPRLGGVDLNIAMKGERAIVSGSTHTEEQRDLVLNITGRYVGRDRVIDSIEVDDLLIHDICEA